MQSVVSTTNSYSYIFSQWLHPPPVCQSTPSDSIHPSRPDRWSPLHTRTSHTAVSLTNSLHSKSMHTIYRGTLCQGEQMYKINILAVCLLSCKPWFRNHINQGTAWLRPGKGGRREGSGGPTSPPPREVCGNRSMLGRTDRPASGSFHFRHRHAILAGTLRRLWKKGTGVQLPWPRLEETEKPSSLSKNL